jgi:hypothetical protein
MATAVLGLSLVPAALAALRSSTNHRPPHAPALGVIADFNGDGFSDLAVGVPGEDVNGHPDAGGVNVIYGSATGLTAMGNQFWTESSPGVPGATALGDQFGFAVATGDLNGDGYADLAIGIPMKASPVENAGAVVVLYGSANGLTAAGSQLWTQDSPGIAGIEQRGDQFGRSLSIADFNGDGFADLAVGVPFDTLSGKVHPGGVNVIYGSSKGLSSSGNQLWSADVSGMRGQAHPGDLFGFSLAGGDFNGDGFGDLAIGVPGEGPPQSAGAVSVVYGTAAGLSSAGNQLWTQNSPGVRDVAEPFDMFGYSLAAGNFDGKGFSDLAIGVPFEDIGTVANAGGVNVLYGSPNGLSATGNQFWSQAGPILNYPERADEFGFSLAAGDFNGDGKSDLAVGVPGQKVSGRIGAGAANVIYGSASGLTATGNQFWSQDSPGIIDVAEPGDRFAFSVGSASFGNGTQADLVLGVPDEDVGRIKDAGGVNVIYGSASGLSAVGNQFFTQNTKGILDYSDPGDQFGYAVGR